MNHAYISHHFKNTLLEHASMNYEPYIKKSNPDITGFDDVLKMSVVKIAISPSHVDSNLTEANFSPSLRPKSRGI